MAESSKYFKRHELECHGSDCCNHTCVVMPDVLTVLNRFREHVGGPVSISCAFRCITHNRDVGSEDTSQHPKGTAADIHCPAGWITNSLFVWLCNQPEVGAVGTYSWGCHFDIRPRVDMKVKVFDRRG